MAITGGSAMLPSCGDDAASPWQYRCCVGVGFNRMLVVQHKWPGAALRGGRFKAPALNGHGPRVAHRRMVAGLATSEYDRSSRIRLEHGYRPARSAAIRAAVPLSLTTWPGRHWARLPRPPRHGLQYDERWRLKHAIAPLTGALDVVRALKPGALRWKADERPGVGFLAMRCRGDRRRDHGREGAVDDGRARSSAEDRLSANWYHGSCWRRQGTGAAGGDAAGAAGRGAAHRGLTWRCGMGTRPGD